METIGGEGEDWSTVERKEGGLSTSHRGTKMGDHMCSFSRSKSPASYQKENHRSRVLLDRIGLNCFPLQSVREKIRVYPQAMRREKAWTGTEGSDVKNEGDRTCILITAHLTIFTEYPTIG